MVRRPEGISIAQFYDLVKICDTREAILLEGDTGIGKTTIVRDFAENVAHLPLCTIQVSESTDLVDVFGLPDFESGRTVYKPPSWYLPGQKCVLFMDEVNRNKQVMKGLMRLATDHRIGDIVLPEGSYVMAAINPEFGNVYQVVEMDPAHKARFQLALLNPTVDEWLAFGEKEHLHQTVLSYIRNHPEDLDTFHNQENVTAARGQYYHHVLPCRRQFHELSYRLYNAENFDNTGKSRFDMKLYDDAEDMLYHVTAGLVGVGVAERFTPFYYRRGLTAEQLLYGTEDDWSKHSDMVKELKKMAKEDIAGLAQLGNDLMGLLARKEDTLWNDFHSGPSNTAAKYGTNVFKFLYLCPPEVVSDIYHSKVSPALQEANRRKEMGKDDGPKWEKLICMAVPKIHDLFDKYVK